MAASVFVKPWLAASSAHHLSEEAASVEAAGHHPGYFSEDSQPNRQIWVSELPSMANLTSLWPSAVVLKVVVEYRHPHEHRVLHPAAMQQQPCLMP
jgi:hypothetical protein